MTTGSSPIAAVQSAKMRSFIVADGTWLPTDEDVLAFESGLDAFVRSKPEAAAFGDRLGEYAVQYHGVTNREQKVLRADFVCKTSGKDPSSEVVSVKGGGDCYFHVTYDMATRAHTALWVNGNR